MPHPVGIYVHVPFCQTRCNYCHFVTRPLDAAVAARYAVALAREIETFFTPARRSAVDTIYFGGGTPSIVPPGQIESVLSALRNLLDVTPDCEITLEANPGTLTAEKLRQYSLMGINRVSMGAQSYDDEELMSIGRVHTAADVRESVKMLRTAGMTNINLDLMAGLPGQTRQSWRRSLDAMVELGPGHVSMYMLDLDSHSPLYHSIATGAVSVPEDDQVADSYLDTIECLESAGYLQYEISNFSRPGFESRHNLKYWTCQPVLGFGVGSHSYDGAARYANESNLAAYLQRVEHEGSAVCWHEPTAPQRELEETLFLGLRLRRGIDWNALRERFGVEQVARYEKRLAGMTEEGLLEWRGAVVNLTRRGMLLSNEVFQQFV